MSTYDDAMAEHLAHALDRIERAQGSKEDAE